MNLYGGFCVGSVWKPRSSNFLSLMFSSIHLHLGDDLAILHLDHEAEVNWQNKSKKMICFNIKSS